jgi:hypothetical protein
MARSRRAIVSVSTDPVEDTRPVGALLLADGSGAAFAQRFNTPELVPNARPHIPLAGIRTVDARMLPYYDPQYRKRHAEDEE